MESSPVITPVAGTMATKRSSAESAAAHYGTSSPKKAGDPGGPCVSRGDEASPDCVLWPADEWVTITQQVTIGKWVSNLNDPARSSNVRIWMQRPAESRCW